ncbi:MAG: tetratricopeptide repeat protein, partial [Acidobacteria bacterium]|nr:tetratricopeptide repeat protein [Acidobacteriota bacterium]
LAFKTDYATMEKELEKYVRQSKYKTSRATFKDKLLFENSMNSAPMSESEANANLGDLLFNLRRYDEAETKLKESLAADPLGGMANATLGMLKMRQEKYGEAESYLEKAVKSESSNYRIYYQYAYVLSHEGKESIQTTISTEKKEKIKNALKKAIEINPSFPGSYDLMAYLSLRTGEDIDEGIDYLSKALKLSPGNQTFMLNLANLYLRKRDIEKAIPIVESVYKTSDEQGIRDYASQLLASLREYQNQVAKAKENGYQISEDSNPGIRMIRREGVDPEKPLTPEEEKARDRDFQNQSINSMMRKPASSKEKRILGYLSKIECKGGSITYTVNTEGVPTKLESEDFESLELMAFKRDMTDLEIGCGSIKRDTFAVVTYLPKMGLKAGVLGTIVAIEFVPEDFILQER